MSNQRRNYALIGQDVMQQEWEESCYLQIGSKDPFSLLMIISESASEPITLDAKLIEKTL